MAYKVIKNHTKEEYDQKYGNKNLKVLTVEEVTKEGSLDESLLEDKTWWFIDNKYYEVEQSKCPVLVWWFSLNKIMQIGIVACVLLIIALAIIIPISIASKKSNNDTPVEDVNIGTVNLTYYASEDCTFNQELTRIKVNQTSWTIKLNVENDEIYDWYIGFYAVNGEDWVLVAKSDKHDGASVPGAYSETVKLEKDIDITTYQDQTLTVVYCGNAK